MAPRQPERRIGMLGKKTLRRLLPRRIAAHRILGGPLRGRRIVTSWHDYPSGILGYTERHLLEWFSANVRPSETWLDVGAHYGYTALALSGLVGGTGRVFAFEPVLATAGHLAETKALNRLWHLVVVPFGLGTTKRLTLMSVPLVRGMAEHSRRTAPAAETIFVVSFDEVWESLSSGTPKVDGIKIDVQGMEIDVLTGMSRILRACHPKLVVELHPGVSRQVFAELLESHGYSAAGAPVTMPEEATADLQDDCSYVFSSSGFPKPLRTCQ